MLDKNKRKKSREKKTKYTSTADVTYFFNTRTSLIKHNYFRFTLFTSCCPENGGVPDEKSNCTCVTKINHGSQDSRTYCPYAWLGHCTECTLFNENQVSNMSCGESERPERRAAVNSNPVRNITIHNFPGEDNALESPTGRGRFCFVRRQVPQPRRRCSTHDTQGAAPAAYGRHNTVTLDRPFFVHPSCTCRWYLPGPLNRHVYNFYYCTLFLYMGWHHANARFDTPRPSNDTTTRGFRAENTKQGYPNPTLLAMSSCAVRAPSKPTFCLCLQRGRAGHWNEALLTIVMLFSVPNSLERVLLQRRLVYL